MATQARDLLEEQTAALEQSKRYRCAPYAKSGTETRTAYAMSGTEMGNTGVWTRLRQVSSFPVLRPPMLLLAVRLSAAGLVLTEQYALRICYVESGTEPVRARGTESERLRHAYKASQTVIATLRSRNALTESRVSSYAMLLFACVR
eukprot:1170482-Rhodomonas_salina.2